MPGPRWFIPVFLVTVVATVAVTYLLVSVFGHQQEARVSFFKVVDVQPGEPNPAVWAENFPQQYEGWHNTILTTTPQVYSQYGRYGASGSSKLDKDPALLRLFAGSAYVVAYGDPRGHANALADMQATTRLNGNKPGSCMTCKSSQTPLLMQQLGVQGFYDTPVKDLIAQHGVQYSISCADCHDAKTMALSITRPAFREAMASRGIDLSKATLQEMRTYVCAQCHAEYYFAPPSKTTVTFPWKDGLTADAIDKFYSDIGFFDWTNPETNTPSIKIQHPDYELYSTSIHAQVGVACADCHMPYERVGATKVSSHDVDSPLLHVDTSCLTCHRESEAAMRQRVLTIQDATHSQMQRAESALLAAMDEIKAAMAAGVPDAKLAEARSLDERAQLRWDYISSANSMGFHNPEEAARVLGDSIDLARQAQLSAQRARLEKQWLVGGMARLVSRLLPIALVVALGVLTGIGAYTFVYARGYSYLLDEPAVCTNCHVMRDEYDGWIASPHKSVTCDGCHTPHEIVQQYMVRAEDGFAHSFAFTFENPQVIQIKPASRAIVEANCKSCHSATVESTFLAAEGAGVDGRDCTRCHFRVGHAL